MTAAKAVAALAALIALSACEGGGGQEQSDLGAYDVRLPDGRTVTCVTFDGGSYASGLDCDWEGARQ